MDARDIDTMKFIRANVLAILARFTDPERIKVSYEIDGQKVDWTRHQEMLVDLLKFVTERIDVAEMACAPSRVVEA